MRDRHGLRLGADWDMAGLKATHAEVVRDLVLVQFSNGRRVMFDPEALWKYREEPWNELVAESVGKPVPGMIRGRLLDPG